ncbi:MAG TPA: MBL fold metallo-hydrolase [Planctomycetota bacterium]|nr:MBL fold metallo-hydrolase [Planctomycetota bacterium]
MPLAFKPIIDGVGYVEIPDSGGHSSVYVVGSPRDALIVDAYTAGIAPDIASALEAAGVRPGAVRAIVVTHGHQDHFGGAGVLSRWSGAPVWASLSAALQAEDPWGYFAAPNSWSANASVADWDAFRAGAGEGGLRVERILREGDVIEHAGMRLDVLLLPGHDRGELGLWERSRRLIFTGDLIQGGMDASKNWLGLFTDPASQRRSLQRVAALRPEWNFKGHRRARSGEEVGADIASALGRLDAIERALLESLREKSPQGVPALTRAAFRGVLGMEVAEPANYATVSVLSFLLDMARRGLVLRTAEHEWIPVRK